MYQMKNIVPLNNTVELPKCMYHIKPMNEEFSLRNESEMKIREQVIKFLKSPQNTNLTALEDRQGQLLKKLDSLYDRIMQISSFCKLTECSINKITSMNQGTMTKPEEIVLELSSESLPWFLKFFLKHNKDLRFTWHIHSTTPSAKVQTIKSFFETLNTNKESGKINMRLIFKDVSANTELKISSLGLPITGNVNVIRYLCGMYPNSVSYDYSDYIVEGLLDLCYLLEKASEKQKQVLCKKIFQSYNFSPCGNFTIVDLVLYNEIKQALNFGEFIPKQWLVKCEKVM